jgi:CheY-like chemotaxis protein
LQPQILDLNSLVSDMGKMLRRLIGMHIELSTDLATDLGKVKAEQSQIEQVIVNLAVNARDAMPEGGKLRIETSNLDVGEDLASSFPFLQPGPYVLLTVTDTGVGMDANTRRHIFEPFFTTKGPGKGTGLGLATVYGVVKQSGGGIIVDSEPGHGATFKIFLPQTQEVAVEIAPEEITTKGPTATGTILVVEDEEALLNITAERLAESGYTILTARDGLHALEIARSFNGRIHLLVTDILMPKMGGLALARNLAELRPGIRVVFMTGHADREASYREALRSGADSIQKPFSHDQLIRLVRQALETAQMQAQD